MTRRMRWVGAAGLVGAAGVSLWLHLALYPWAFDDAYIHFRIADHYVRFGAPYYHVDEPILATSSPAWTLVLAVLRRLAGRDGLVPATAALNALCTVAGSVVYVRWLQSVVGGARRSPAAWCFAVPYASLVQYASIGMMETPLALLVAGVGLWTIGRRRPVGFVALGICPFLRLELAVLPALFLAHQALGRHRLAGRATGWTAAGAAPFAAWELAYFGTLIPHTVHAKAIVYSLMPGQVLYLLLQGAVPLLESIRGGAGRIAVGGVVVFAATACVLLVERRAVASVPSAPVRIVLAWGWIVGGVYLVSGGLVFPWYLPLVGVPLTWALFAAALRHGTRRWAVLVLVPVLAAHLVLLARTARAAAGRPETFRYFAENGRVRKYLETGAALRELHPDATLLSPEIGGIGWGFRGRVVDAVGLVSPEALAHHPMAVPSERSAGYLGAIPPSLVQQIDPELIVTLDIFAEAFLRSPLRQRYTWSRTPIYVSEDLERGAGPVLWGSTALNVFVRRDVAGRRAGEPAACAPPRHAVTSESSPGAGGRRRTIPPARGGA